MPIKKILLLVVVIIVYGSCDNFRPNVSEIPLAELEKIDTQKIHFQNVLKNYQNYIEDALDTLNLPSVAYAIVKDGQVVKQYIHGVKKVGKKDSIDKNTVFRMASISKSFAAVLASVLVDKGAFAWEDKVKKLVPRFRLRKSKNTKELRVKHILSHTSGLKKYAMTKDIQADKPYQTIFRNLRKAPVLNGVGEVYNYQNAIYSVISNIVKEKTKFSYEKMLDSMLFTPLKMPTVSVGHRPMNDNKNKAYPHIPKGKEGYQWKQVKLRTTWYNVNPAAGVNASLSDMTIWLKAMLGHYPSVISPQALTAVFEPQISLNEDNKYAETWGEGLTKTSYGMGWRSFDFKGNRIIYHGGWLRGYRPEMGFCPKEDIGIVFLTNADRNDLASSCIAAFFQMYFSENGKANKFN